MMSLFKFPKLRRFSSALESVRGRFARSNGRSTGERAYRRLLIDPLEERQLLSLSPWNIDDNMVNQTITESQGTIAAQSVAADHDGDFVVAWTRYDSTGGALDANIYARYFTDEVQRITLPDEVIVNNNPGSYGTFSLTYGGNEIQKITVTETYGPFGNHGNPIIGDIVLDFAGTPTAPIAFSEFLYENTAGSIQTALQALGGPLSDVTVQAINPHEYLVYFGDASLGQDQPQLTVDSSTTFASGYLPGVQIETIREPITISGIPVSPDDPEATARVIEEMFRTGTAQGFSISPIEFPPPERVPPIGPYIFPAGMSAALPRISVTPISATQFDITFGAEVRDGVESDSSKKDHPELVISAVADENGVSLMGSPQIDVTTLKQTSPEFRVNDVEPDDPFTPWPDVTDQTAPAVVMDADGDFVITWQSEIPDSQNFGSVSDIFARRFSPAAMVNPADVEFVQGVRALGEQFQVNTFTTNAQSEPAIGMDDDGNFVIAWANEGQDISYFNGIVAQRFNRDGERVGNEWLVNTEDTGIHLDPYAAMSSDGHFVVTWTRGGVLAELYDPGGAVLLEQFDVGRGFAPTAAFDMDNNFVVTREGLFDNDNIGITSGGIRVVMYDLQGDIIRPEFRANSASLDPDNEAPLWPLGQGGAQVALDADGDMTISYDGFGPDVSEATFDVNIDAMLLAAKNDGATDFELGQLRIASDDYANLLRGEANGAMFSRWDTDPQLAGVNNLASDCIANNYRDGHNARYIISIDQGVAGGDFTVRVSHPSAGYNDVVIEPVIRENEDGSFTFLVGPTRAVIENVLEAAVCTGINWPQPPFGGPVAVRIIGSSEIIERQGTDWELTGSVPADFVYEVIFQGEVHDTAMGLSMLRNDLVMAPIEEVQTLYFDATADGWFALGFGDNTTDDIYWNNANPGSPAGTIGNMLEGAGADDVDVVYLGPDGAGNERFEVTFGGDDAGEDQPDITQATAQNHASPDDLMFIGTIWSTEDVRGHIPPAPAPWVPLYASGNDGTVQSGVSIAMQPDGDFVMAWTQYDEYTFSPPPFSNANIYYRQFNESTDTAGPMATDFLLPDGSRLSDGGQVIDPLQYIIVTFDEEMMTEGVHDVTDPQNWVLLQDDVAVIGGIADIQYGMNMASELAVPYGLYAVGSNKWEAVIMLDGNGDAAGITPLLDGHYEIVARNSLCDAAGNPLGRTGFEINGEDSGRRFDVVIPTGNEIRVNGQTVGDQKTFPHSPQATAADSDGDYVVVWTSDLPGAEGVYAKMYDVTWTDGAAGRTSITTEMVIINPDTGLPWVNNEIFVSSDPTATFASVARDADGDFVVTWSVNDVTTSWDVYARRYDAAGNALDDAFLVNTEIVSAQKYSTVAMDTDGDFVITWQSLDQDGSGYGVYAQRYDTVGISIGGTDEVQMIEFVDDPTGTFALRWDHDQSSITPDLVTVVITYAGNTADAAVQIENALNGIGAEVEVDAISMTDLSIRFVGAAGSKNQAPIALDPASTNITGGADAAITLSTRVNGASGEFRVNDTIDNHQLFPSIAMSSDGMFVVSWTSYGQDGDASYESNVYVKQFPSNDALWDIDSAMAAAAYNTINPIEGLHYQMCIVTVDDPANHVVDPGTGYDGVVQVDLGWGIASGTLLLGGRYVLTASHVVWDDIGRAPLPASDVSIVFDTTAGPIRIQASEIFVAPDYNGDPFAGGDVAVIMLSENAPDGVETYDIYRGAGEIGTVVEKFGYGRTGTGDTGAIDSDELKRSGMNRYEALGSILGLTDKLMVYDFDNGLAENDAFGVLLDIHDLGEGNDEICAAPGDSGGPNFINGMIASVSTGLGSYPGDHDVVPGVNSSFGDFGMDTRVSDYADWIDSITKTRSEEILVNESFIANDQKWSSVAMDFDGDFVVTWTSYGQDGVGNGPGAGVDGQEGVFARRFNSSADPTGDEFNVNTFGDLQQQHSRVAMDADGDFVITWESFQDRLPGGSDTPDSFGIYAQQYVRDELIGTNPFIGSNGELGSELAVNTTTDGDQRYPGIAIDDTGDFVIVWSGNGQVPGQEDDQGIFSQRYYRPEDNAGPIVADVLNVVQAAGGGVELQRVKEGTVLPSSVTQFVLSMGENLSIEGIASGTHSVLNLENWHLTKDGTALTGGVAAVEFGLSMTSTGLANDPSEKYESVVTFDGDPLTAGVQPLERGVYVLTLKDSVEDIFGNSLDGNYDGRPHGHYQLNFSIQVGSGSSDPGYPGGPGDPGDGSEDGQVNTDWANAQNDPAVASNDDGDHVIVWVTYNDAGEGDIAAQRFDRFGRAIGSEFTINAHMASGQIEPDVAMDRFGNFVVTWSGVGENDDSGVFARVFDQYGMPLGDQFRVNEYWQSIQDAPAVAMDSSGNFVVSWTSYGQDGDRDGVFARRYNLRGEPLGGEFQVNSTFTNRQENPDIAMDANGNFAVVWASDAQDGSSWGVYGQRYNDAGVKQGGEFRINTIVNDKQIDPQIAMDADGDFVVAWSSFSDDNTPSGPRTGYDIYARRYNAAGVAQNASEFLVNQTVPHWQVTPAVSMADDGMFAITWSTYAQDNEVTEDYGIYSRIYNPNGSDYVDPATGAVVGEFRVNANVAGDQTQPAIAMDADGDFVVTWTGPGDDQTEIYRRIIALNPDTYTTGSTTGGSTTGGFINTGGGGGGDPSGDTTVFVTGTQDDDTFEFIGGATSGIWTVILNGVLQNIGNDAVAVSFNGIGGNDTVMLYGTDSNDVFELWPDRGTLVGTGYTVSVVGVESITVEGLGGDDSVMLYDSDGDDLFVGWRTGAFMETPNGINTVADVDLIVAKATGAGHDMAKFYDSPGDDLFVTAPTYGKMYYADGLTTQAESFTEVHAFATAGGHDVAKMYDSVGNDTFYATPIETALFGDGFYNRAKYFDEIHGFATAGGEDLGLLFDSEGDDTFYAAPVEGAMYGQGYYNRAKYFDVLRGDASQGGNDAAALFDSLGSDLLVATPTYASLSGDGFNNLATNFDNVKAYATVTDGQYDMAKLYDSPGDDLLVTTPTYGSLSGNGYRNQAVGFDGVNAFATAGGHDVAKMYDSVGNDTFYATPIEAALFGDGFYNRAKYFDEIHAFATASGVDEAHLFDSSADDTFYASSVDSAIYNATFYNRAKFFEKVYAHSDNGGNDTAYLFDATLESGPGTRDMNGLGTEFAKVAWLYEFEKLYAADSSDEPVEQAVDAVITSYWE